VRYKNHGRKRISKINIQEIAKIMTFDNWMNIYKESEFNERRLNNARNKNSI
jgi:hypothetical protein